MLQVPGDLLSASGRSSPRGISGEKGDTLDNDLRPLERDEWSRQRAIFSGSRILDPMASHQVASPQFGSNSAPLRQTPQRFCVRAAGSDGVLNPL